MYECKQLLEAYMYHVAELLLLKECLVVLKYAQPLGLLSQPLELLSQRLYRCLNYRLQMHPLRLCMRGKGFACTAYTLLTLYNQLIYNMVCMSVSSVSKN